MYFDNMITILVLVSVLRDVVSADLKVLSTTATSIEWDLEGNLKAGNKYTVEVFLDTGAKKERIIDEPIRTNIKTYRAFNLKSNRVYQLQIRMAGVKGIHLISPPTYTNLKCYSCTGVKNVESCTKVIECSPNERQCYTRVRYTSKLGGRFSISKGCKVSTDVCKPNMERIKIQREASSETGDLTDEQVLKTMPGLKFFGNLQKLFEKSPSILKQVKKKYNANKKNMLPNALKNKCSKREDPTNFCRCCCNSERCNHGFLDCGITEAPEYVEKEPLPPDIATTAAPTTLSPTRPPKIAPACRDYNGGCDHICIAINKTAVRCECFENYKLQKDGQTCKTHLRHAYADAGPDITITLPQTSVTISAINTKGSVKRYRWWAPISYGDRAGLTVSNTTDRDLKVVNLSVGTYKFILTVTGMDGRRSTDVMTLTVKPHPSTVNYTEEAAKAKVKAPKPRIRALGQSRFGSVMQRKEYKNYVRGHNVTTLPPSTTSPLLLFSTKPTTKPKIKVLGRPRVSKPKTTPSPTKQSKVTKPIVNRTRKPNPKRIRQTTPKSRRTRPTGTTSPVTISKAVHTSPTSTAKPKRIRPTSPNKTTTKSVRTSPTTTAKPERIRPTSPIPKRTKPTRKTIPTTTTTTSVRTIATTTTKAVSSTTSRVRSPKSPVTTAILKTEQTAVTAKQQNTTTTYVTLSSPKPSTKIGEATPPNRATVASTKPDISKAMPTPTTTTLAVKLVTRRKRLHQGKKTSSGKKGRK